MEAAFTIDSGCVALPFCCCFLAFLDSSSKTCYLMGRSFPMGCNPTCDHGVGCGKRNLVVGRVRQAVTPWALTYETEVQDLAPGTSSEGGIALISFRLLPLWDGPGCAWRETAGMN
jgi:hypothetical protein